MKEITKIMIKDFKIMKLGIDFMGYKVDKKENLSFHHLIVPHRNCKEMGLGDGYFYWNGAILMQRNSHEYLHIIEQKDIDIFNYITSEMIDMNHLGKLTEENLKKIDEVLNFFEREHCADKGSKGRYLIKEEYIRGRKR